MHNAPRRPSTGILSAAPLLPAIFLAGCVSSSSSSAGAEAQMAGSDRDARGCIGSAGYRWCAREKECTRPWELAARAGIDNGEAAFSHYCEPDVPAVQ